MPPTTRPSRQRASRRAVPMLLPVVAWCGCQCAPPVPPPAEFDVIGTGFFTGQVYLDEASIGGANVEVAGTAARASSVAGRDFALYPIPVGDQVVSIHDPSSGRAARFTATVVAENQTVALTKEQTSLGAPATILGVVTVPAPASPLGALAFVVGGGGGETATVGDDGSFILRGVPAGPATIAVGLAGYDLASVDVNIVEGPQDLPDALALVPLGDANATVNLTGSAQLLGTAVDHAGTLIVVDDGVVHSTTNSAGTFSVAVAPGHHSIRAEHAGYLSVVLPTVAVHADGSVRGLVPMFLAPGQDADTRSRLQIAAPRAGDVLVAGVPLPVTADLVGSDVDPTLPGRVEWWARELGTSDPGVLIGTGAVTAATVPVELALRTLEIEARIPGTGYVDAVAVTTERFTHAEVRVGVDAALVQAPVLQLATDGALEVEVSAGEPAVLVKQAAVDGTVVWTSNTGLSFVETLDLGSVPVGEHAFTGSVALADGAQASLDVRVRVIPLVFTVDVAEPVEGTSYFTDDSLPLRATLVHPYQVAFPSTAVRWLTETGDAIGLGAVSSTHSAPTGTLLLQLEVTDVTGNVRTALRTYSYVPLAFTAAFNAPANGTAVAEGAPVTFNVGYSHPTLAAEDAVVTLTSDRQGVLAVDGVSTFAPDTPIVIANLVPGLHHITARVLGLGRIASTSIDVTVNADFVTANLQAPAGPVVAIDGTALRFAVIAGASAGTTPRITWLVDGVPFLDAWDRDGDYDALDAQAPGNAVVDLGTYVSSPVPSAPFDDVAHWGPGTHSVQAWVRLPTAAAEANGCVNNGALSRCLSFPLTVFPSLTVKGGAGDVQLVAGDVEVWSGGIVLKANYNIDGGTLVIQPGTTVVVDMANRSNASVQDATPLRRIDVHAGTLQVGASGAVPPVQFAVRRAFATQNRWLGIRTLTQTAGVPRTITIQNTTIADAQTGVDTAPSGVHGANNVFVLEDVTIDGAYTGISTSCPSSFARVTVKNSTIAATFGADPDCPTSWGIDGAQFLNNTNGVTINAAAREQVRISHSTFSGSTSGNGLTFGVRVDAIVEDSTFEAFGLGYSGTYGLRFDGNIDGSLLVQRCTFTAGGNALYLGGADAPSTVIDNTFSGNARAVAVAGNRMSAVEMHVNRFVANDIDVAVTGGNTDDVNAQANYFGAPTDPRSTAGMMAAAPAGSIPQLSRITDGVDQTAYARVHTDNPLATPEVPLAFVRLPEHMASYNPELCLPLVAESPLGAVNVATDCGWTAFTPGGSAANGVALTADANGCAEQTLGDGLYALTLTCTQPDSGLVSVHETRLRVSAASFSGHVRAPGLTIDRDVLIDGDLMVDADAVLRVTAGGTLRVAPSDRLRHSAPAAAGSGRVGSSSEVEIFVAGALEVVGVPGDPAELRADGVQGNALWGGVVVEPGGRAALSYADVQSPAVLTTGQVVAAEPFVAPDISISDTTFGGVDALARGTCPRVLSNVTGTYLDGGVVNCTAAQDVVIEALTVDDLRGNTVMVDIDGYTGTAPTVRIANSQFIGHVGGGVFLTTRPPVENVVLERLVVDGFSTFFSGYTHAPLAMTDTVARHFSHGLLDVYPDAAVSIDHCTFEDGPRLVADSFGLFTMHRTRVTNVATPFLGTNTNGVTSITVTGNQFEGAETVFAIDSFAAVAGIPTWTLSGNNYVDMAGPVLTLSGSTAVLVTTFNLTGSWFGAGADTRAAIEPLLLDARADANPNDTRVGNTDYTGFVTSPLLLDLP